MTKVATMATTTTITAMTTMTTKTTMTAMTTACLPGEEKGSKEVRVSIPGIAAAFLLQQEAVAASAPAVLSPHEQQRPRRDQATAHLPPHHACSFIN